MSEFAPTEKGVPIRYPSTANLMIDSNDGISKSPSTQMSDFTITRSQALLNGFFTRIAVTEVVLNWEEPNIRTGSNDDFSVTKTATGVTYTITLSSGQYTIAQCLDQIVILLNGAGTGLTWSISGIGALCSLTSTGAFTVGNTTLAVDLGLFGGASSTSQYLFGPNLQFYSYLDIVSDQLTYNQSVKDASTTINDHNVLCRWYMAWDTQPQLDAYGFPILMGYTSFSCRRIFNSPKQIRWMPNMPIGNLTFQIYPDGASRVLQQNTDTANPSSLQMTLQVSEV